MWRRQSCRSAMRYTPLIRMACPALQWLPTVQLYLHASRRPHCMSQAVDSGWPFFQRASPVLIGNVPTKQVGAGGGMHRWSRMRRECLKSVSAATAGRH